MDDDQDLEKKGPYVHFVGCPCEVCRRKRGEDPAPAAPRPETEQLRQRAEKLADTLENMGEVWGADVVCALMSALAAATPPPAKSSSRYRFDCQECGQGVAADEDGCCRMCGADAEMVTGQPAPPPAEEAPRCEMPNLMEDAESPRCVVHDKLCDWVECTGWRCPTSGQIVQERAFTEQPKPAEDAPSLTHAPAGFSWVLVCQGCGDTCSKPMCPKCYALSDEPAAPADRKEG